MDYFKDTIQESGVILSYDDAPNTITQEQSLVIRDLERNLQSNAGYPNNLPEFVDGLKIFCQNETLYYKALSPTILKKISNIDDSIENILQSNIKQDSIFRMLLNVNCVQTEIIEKILDDITTHAIEDEQNSGWVRMLLNVLRYISHIKDASVLTVRLLDILEVATVPSLQEILSSIPDILPDYQNNEIAKHLSKMLESHTELGAIIDCLNSLNLNAEIRADVQEFVLQNIIMSSTSINIFPILFEFLTTDCKSQNLPSILLKVRNMLDNIMCSGSENKEGESMKLIIYKKLKSAMHISKPISEGWITVISHVQVDSEHKPVDLQLLFMLHACSPARKYAVEALFKKRIKSKLFKASLVETYFRKYINAQILHENLASIVEIASNLLRNHKEYLITEFGSALYKNAFVNEHTTRVQCQNILQQLILHTGLNNEESASLALSILMDLLLESPQKMRQHILKLLELLEKLDMFQLKDVKTVFDILCSLTCGELADVSNSSAKDQLHMLVHKQLTCSKKFMKHRGIICAIVMAKHIAMVSEEQSEVSIMDKSLLISDLPNEAAREAAKMLEFTSLAATESPVLRGLYYDQLASMIMSADNLENNLQAWLFETITKDFEDVYVTETVPDPIHDIALASQYCLNAVSEVEVSIYLNIAGLSMKTQYQENSCILILPSIFHILRLLHYKQHAGDLSSIDALLGCGVILPVIETIDTFESHQIKQIADCIFHCINWFRELVSAFVKQKMKLLRQKVLRRLQNIIDLEDLLNKCLNLVPDHKLPDSYFYNVTSRSNKIGSPRKPEKIERPKKRAKLNADETVTSNVPTQTSKSSSSKSNVDHKSHIEFREIDTDVILLLKYPLGNTQEESQTQDNLNLKQFNFLLNDFVFKLHALTKSKNMGLSNLMSVNPCNLITDCSRLLPCITNHLKIITNSLNMLLEEVGSDQQVPQMFTTEALELKTGFGIIMQAFSLIFRWSGFHQPKHMNLLKDCLKAFHADLQSQSQLKSTNKLITEFLDQLSKYTKNCLYLSSAVHLIETMEALYAINMNPDYKKKINSASEKLLAKRWYNLNGNPDTGKQAFANLDVLVKAYLNGANLKTICGLVATLQEQARELKTKKDYLLMLPSIDKGSFHILYRGLCQVLLEKVRTEVHSLSNNQHLVLWKTTGLTMQGLMVTVKSQDTRSNLVSFSKRSLGILKVFLTQGIPILEIMLRSKPNEVIEIFKIVQLSTRFLHHLCCHSKLTKDSALIAFVPQFRLTIETIIYRVKAALVANNCSAAFWMGNLKNKDLDGEIISSQGTSITESSSGAPDEELSEDETDDDILDQDATADNTASDVYD